MTAVMSVRTSRMTPMGTAPAAKHTPAKARDHTREKKTLIYTICTAHLQHTRVGKWQPSGERGGQSVRGQPGLDDRVRTF